jgi:hypothetical protein
MVVVKMMDLDPLQVSNTVPSVTSLLIHVIGPNGGIIAAGIIIPLIVIAAIIGFLIAYKKGLIKVIKTIS